VAVRQIRLFGDPVLREKATEVADFDKELRRLVQDLADTLLDAGGAGLAAPQIGVGLRVFAYDVEDSLGHLVNPVLTEVSEEQDESDEGCLSFPGLYFPCRRSARVVVSGFDVHGDPVNIDSGSSALLARCAQHEIDHLDGVLFIDRLDRAQRKIAMRAIREAEWNGGPVPTVQASPHPIHGGGR
jgi:peptide deformylase